MDLIQISHKPIANSDADSVLLFTLQDGNPILYFSRYVVEPTAKSLEAPLSMHRYQRRVTVVVRECSRRQTEKNQLPPLTLYSNNKMGCTPCHVTTEQYNMSSKFRREYSPVDLHPKQSGNIPECAYLESKVVRFVILNRKCSNSIVWYHTHTHTHTRIQK